MTEIIAAVILVIPQLVIIFITVKHKGETEVVKKVITEDIKPKLEEVVKIIKQ